MTEMSPSRPKTHGLRKGFGAFIAAIFALLAPIASASAAHATDNTDPTPYVLVAWKMPTFIDNSTASFPQGEPYAIDLATKDLSALDSWVAQQPYGCFQIDGYYDNATTTSLLAGGHLDGPGNPQEALWGGGWGVAYKLVQVGTGCTPPKTVTVNFDFQPGSPSCVADGTLPVLPAKTEGYTLAWDRPFDVPGDYTLTATADKGLSIEGPASKVFTVLPRLNLPGPECPVVVKVEPVQVEQMYCSADKDGSAQTFVPAKITAPVSGSVTYSIEGGNWDDLGPGTYTVTATPNQYHLLDAKALPEGWTLNKDGTASVEVTIAQPNDCIKPFTETRQTVEKKVTCDLVTESKVDWKRDWTIVEDKLVAGEWVEVGRVASEPRKPTPAEITAEGLTCQVPPPPPPPATCPGGTTWVDANSNHKVDAGECRTVPGAATGWEDHLRQDGMSLRLMAILAALTVGLLAAAGSVVVARSTPRYRHGR